MELHVVFFKQEYKNMKQATQKSDGLAVMAFFFKVANVNPAYVEFSNLLNNIIKPHSTATFQKPPTLKSLIDTNMHEYYVYNGSLTTPPCLEIVTWLGEC
jgi:carbonic anhydrase